MSLLAAANRSSAGTQLCNPPLVHGLAVLAAVQGSHAEAVALARGDGCVAVHQLTSKVTCSIRGLGPLSWNTRSHCHEALPWVLHLCFPACWYRLYLVSLSGHKLSPSVLQGRSSAASRSKARHAKGKVGGQTQQWQELCLLGPDHKGHSAAVNSM